MSSPLHTCSGLSECGNLESLNATQPSHDLDRARSEPLRKPLKASEIAILAGACVLLASSSRLRWLPIAPVEAWGFITGAVCVWFVVREHVWNWPVGLLNNVFFFILFFKGRLFADMALQVVYFALGVYGWVNWMWGGQNHSRLHVTRATRLEWIALLVSIPLGTWAVREILFAVNGAAPFWDALTTVISLAAQYLLCRKRFENWFFWIAADLIYVPLYLSRSLPLTAVLYTVFLGMCLVGLRAWAVTMRKERIP